MKRIHVIGPPRSGTTLMLELMINCFRFSIVSKREVSLLEVPEGIPEEGTICTKNPQDHRLVSSLIDRDQGQWFISMIRDPRDIICSRHGLHPEVYWANLRQWRGWLENTRAFRNHPRLIEVRYEELSRTPDAVQETVAERLDFIPVTRRFSEFHQVAEPSDQSLRAMGKVRPIDDSSVRRWTGHLPRVAGQIAIHGPITKELVELGYEEDDQWLELLEGVVPDTNPGHWPEFIPEEYARKFQFRQQQLLLAYVQARGL